MKNTTRYISTFLVASSLSIGSALAGGSLSHDPYSAWSGFYAGLHAGYGEASFDGIFDNADNNEEAFPSDLDVNGLVAGIQVGYNWQHNNWVIGVEADVSFGSLSDTVEDRNDGGDGRDNITADIDTLASLRARVGFASNSLLVYATGGIAYADASFTAVDANTTGISETADFDKIGYVVGGGLEKAYRGVRLKLEGLYYGFDDTIETGNNFADDGDAGDFVKFEDVVTVRMGISVPFGN